MKIFTNLVKHFRMQNKNPSILFSYFVLYVSYVSIFAFSKHFHLLFGSNILPPILVFHSLSQIYLNKIILEVDITPLNILRPRKPVSLFLSSYILLSSPTAIHFVLHCRLVYTAVYPFSP